jgi:hypothetical protein
MDNADVCGSYIKAILGSDEMDYNKGFEVKIRTNSFPKAQTSWSIVVVLVTLHLLNGSSI